MADIDIRQLGTEGHGPARPGQRARPDRVAKQGRPAGASVQPEREGSLSLLERLMAHPRPLEAPANEDGQSVQPASVAPVLPVTFVHALLDPRLAGRGLQDAVAQVLHETSSALQAGVSLFVAAPEGPKLVASTDRDQPLEPVCDPLSRRVLDSGHAETGGVADAPTLREANRVAVAAAPVLVAGHPVAVLRATSGEDGVLGPQSLDVLLLAAARLALAFGPAQELERLDLEREQEAAHARQAQDLLRMAAHDLMSPLSVARLQLHFLTDGRTSPDVRAKAARVAKRALFQVQVMLGDFLDLARLQGGTFVLHRAPLDLAAAAREGVETFAAVAQEFHVELAADAAAAVEVEADRTRILQVVANLLTNAIRHAPPRTRVEVAARREGSDAVLQVRDHGTGLTPEQAQGAFEPFAKVETRVRTIPGAGLGLYLSRIVAEQHGGSLESAPAPEGDGQVLTLRLPARV